MSSGTDRRRSQPWQTLDRRTSKSEPCSLCSTRNARSCWRLSLAWHKMRCGRLSCRRTRPPRAGQASRIRQPSLIPLPESSSASIRGQRERAKCHRGPVITRRKSKMSLRVTGGDLAGLAWCLGRDGAKGLCHLDRMAPGTDTRTTELAAPHKDCRRRPYRPFASVIVPHIWRRPAWR